MQASVESEVRSCGWPLSKVGRDAQRGRLGKARTEALRLQQLREESHPQLELQARAVIKAAEPRVNPKHPTAIEGGDNISQTASPSLPGG